MAKKQSIIRHILSSFIGILVFLIMIVIVNVITYYVYNPIFNQIVNFLNNNIILIILMSIFLLIGEIFYALAFPFNLPAPLFSAIGAMFIITFVVRIISLVTKLLSNQDISGPITMISYFVYPLVFIIVVVVGYVTIFSSMGKKKTKKD